jgi:NAD+ synthase
MLEEQLEIIEALGTKPEINVQEEIEKRVDFLVTYAKRAKVNGFVLGISGGQDSFNAGMLARTAALYMGGIFVAMRLPYGVQADENDAVAALRVIQANEVFTHNIKTEVDAMASHFHEKVWSPLSDYLKGNDKARARMMAQYRMAGFKNLLVVGTDHAAEAVTGFYTKFGDGACDITPLSTLNKRQGRQLAEALGCPPIILKKKPTADLLDENPGQEDEFELGLTYDQIDDFLEGKEIDPVAARKLIERYRMTQHKRDAIPGI